MRQNLVSQFESEGADNTAYDEGATAHVSMARILGLFRPYRGGSRSSCY